MTGKVVPGSVRHGGATALPRRRPRRRPREHPGHLLAAPSPTPSAAAARSSSPARSQDGIFVGERDTLVTKCPSKFTADEAMQLASAAPPWRSPSSTAIFAAVAALVGRDGERRWVDRSRRAVYGLCALLTLCVVLIEIAFASNDFSFNIVQQHSSLETPTFYKLAAMWSSQEGSLLLWAWVLSIAASRGAVRDPGQAARDRPLRDRGDGWGSPPSSPA